MIVLSTVVINGLGFFNPGLIQGLVNVPIKHHPTKKGRSHPTKNCLGDVSPKSPKSRDINPKAQKMIHDKNHY